MKIITLCVIIATIIFALAVKENKAHARGYPSNIVCLNYLTAYAEAESLHEQDPFFIKTATNAHQAGEAYIAHHCPIGALLATRHAIFQNISPSLDSLEASE
jgi:hypothetical protein